MKNIIWLASYPKSGNTWMRIFLASIIRGEDEFSFNRLSGVSQGCVSKRLYQRVMTELPEYASVAEALGGRAEFQRRLGERVSGKAIFMKTHSFAGQVAGHEMIAADATRLAVVIIRNPFDVCISACNHFGFEIEQSIRFMNNPHQILGKIEGAERQLPAALSSWSRHVVSWLARSDLEKLVVRYEDMVHHPLDEFTRIAAALTDFADERLVLKALSDSNFETLKSQEQTVGFKETSKKSEGFFRSGKVGDGFAKLTPDQRRRIYEPNSRLCRALGYFYSPEDERLAIGPTNRSDLDRILSGWSRNAGPFRRADPAARPETAAV